MRGHCENPLHNEFRWPGANLSRNPFGELTRQERISLACVEVDKIIDHLRKSESFERTSRFHRLRAYQLIGECGRGKSSHLFGLMKAIPSACYVYLPEDGPCPTIPEAEVLLIDEAQRLPRHIRKTIFAAGIPLVIATHRDLTRPLRRAGYHVQSETIGLTLSPEFLAHLLNRRIEASRRDAAAPVPSLSTEKSRELIGQFGTNVREIERHLYDLVQAEVNSHGEMRLND